MPNYLTIFSNGMAHFTRTLPPVKEKTTIQIPVKRSSLADALATLAVFGPVRITEPPSYPAADPDQVLTVDPNNVLRDLAVKLSGSQVEIEEAVSGATRGTLLGYETFEECVGQAVVTHYRFGIFDETGAYRSFLDEQIKAIKFLEANVQEEIKKALERNYAKINPESTLISIGLEPFPGGAENQPIQYQLTIPFSAWQPVYQLRLNDGNACELEASAKIDNPTDEDLSDYIVSVVTGDPNTFETDLAEVRRPRRQRVNLVSDQATGAVEAEDLLMEDLKDTPVLARRLIKSAADGGGAEHLLGVAAARSPAALRAQVEAASASDVGDFAIYTSKNPVNIGRKRSAILPLFQAPAEGKPFLLYKPEIDVKRPFRAVKFKNTTAFSLGRGTCTVYAAETYQGQVVLDATKPGEERTLPHARENGVLVFKNPPGSNGGVTSERRVRVEISKGTLLIDNVNAHETVYRFVNSKPEAFDLEIEHPRHIGDARTVFRVQGNAGPTAALVAGLRIPCQLPARGQLEIRVQETHPVRQTLILHEYPVAKFQALLGNVFDIDKPRENFWKERFRGILDLIAKANQAQENVREAEAEVATLSREQARKLELVKSSGSGGSQADTWRKELALNETAIHTLERERIPQLRKQVKDAETVFTEALRNLSVRVDEAETP
jgi:hypothetical protein